MNKMMKYVTLFLVLFMMFMPGIYSSNAVHAGEPGRGRHEPADRGHLQKRHHRLLHHLFPGHRSSHTPADVQTVELYQASGQRTLTGVSPVLNRLELPGNITGALKAKGVLSRIKSNRRRTAP